MSCAEWVLKQPALFDFFNSFIGISRLRSLYVRDYCCPHAGWKILDIGCGLGDILKYLPESIEYVGLDEDRKYIDYARKHSGKQAKFFCEKFNSGFIREYSGFDIVMANGVLHHLGDKEAVELFKLAFSILKPGGKFLTHDGCYTKEQSFVTRFLLSLDRGKYVRTKEAYCCLASGIFVQTKAHIRTDLLRIPYTHIILECRK